MVGTRSTAREPLEEPSSITESPRPIVTSGGTQDETLHDTAAALPPGGTSAPVAPVTTASNGSHATTTAGVPQPNDTSQPLRDLTAALLEVVRGVRPAPATHRYADLPYFNGNTGDWLYFKSAFVESQSAFTEAENKARLRKCLKGVALESVKGLFVGGIEALEIVERLEARFGRPHALVTNELEKLRHLPKLVDSPREVCIFASKVNNIISTIKALNKIEYLHNPEITNIVCDKLTTVLRHRWYDFEALADASEPRLLVIARFLDREADLNSRHAKCEIVEERKDCKRHHCGTTNTKVNMCPICNASSHYTPACPKFISITASERWEAARKNKLCFRCLGKRTWNHRCKGKKCEAQGCEYYHHKLLHDDAAQPMKSDNGVAAPRQRTQSNRAGGQATVFESCSNATTAAAGALRSVQTYLKVLPVQLSGPHGEIDTYALLDDGSTITLLTSSLADKIGVAGPAAPFVIEAIAGAHIDAVSSQRVKFSIKGKYTNNKINIEARTIDSLNISPQSVPTEALAHCEHLQDISDQLVYATAEPLILIGQDNWSLLIASEVRRGKLEQPVASHTPLGWVLHGQKRVCPYGRGGYMLQERFHCSHAHMKDEALEQLIKEHYDLESLGVEPRRPQADPEIRALQILQKTTKALTEGGYETGLLWKEEEF
nr:uncharacterized protein LOC128677804 [Plodia interpunctella]